MILKRENTSIEGLRTEPITTAHAQINLCHHREASRSLFQKDRHTKTNHSIWSRKSLANPIGVSRGLYNFHLTQGTHKKKSNDDDTSLASAS